MTTTAAAPEHTLDSILEDLDRFNQRATYGAVAGVVDSSPRSLMLGRPREPRSSWIVSRGNRQPTGYSEDQIHPALAIRERVIETPDDLRKWLENPS
jgi:hypothetical protein